MNNDNKTNTVAEEVSKPRKPRGFAAMDPARVKEISSLGGKRAHEMGRAHQFTRDEAISAGRKGGLTSQARKREVPPDNKAA